MVDKAAEGEEQDAGELAVMKAGLERFQPINLLELQHALPVKAALEGADGIQMRRRPIGKER